MSRFRRSSTVTEGDDKVTVIPLKLEVSFSHIREMIPNLTEKEFDAAMNAVTKDIEEVFYFELKSFIYLFINQARREGAKNDRNNTPATT